MLEIFKKINPHTLLYFDIETRAQEPTLVEGSKLYDLVEYACSRTKDYDMSTMEEYYQSNSSLMPELGCICTVSIGFIHNNKLRVTSFSGTDEKDLLLELVGFLHSVNGKFNTTCTFAGAMFDVPFLLLRLMSNGIFDIPKILDETTLKPWEKVSVDLKELVKLGRYSSSSLLGLCTLLGVDSPKDGITGKDVSKAFYDGRIDEITAYCERDVLATANCLLRLRGEELVELESIKLTKRFQETPIEYRSEIDKLFITGDIQPEALAKEAAKNLTKKEQEIYLEIVKAVKPIEKK